MDKIKKKKSQNIEKDKANEIDRREKEINKNEIAVEYDLIFFFFFYLILD